MLKEKIRSALTKTIWVQTGKRKKLERIDIPPSAQFVNLIYFAIAAFIGLTVLEIVHMLFFRVWNSEILSAITGLIGTISGILISQKSCSHLYPSKEMYAQTSLSPMSKLSAILLRRRFCSLLR